MLNVALDLAGKFMSYVHCVWSHLRSNFVILLNVFFESPVGLRLAQIRGSRRSAASTVLMLFTDLVVRHLPCRLFSISVLAGPMCRILCKIPQNRHST